MNVRQSAGLFLPVSVTWLFVSGCGVPGRGNFVEGESAMGLSSAPAIAESVSSSATDQGAGDAAAWSGNAELVPSDGLTGDQFGHAVGVSAGIAVVGAYSHGIGDAGARGAAYVYALGDAGWHEQAELGENGSTAADSFGRAVAVSGTTVVVGAPRRAGSDGGPPNHGAAYVFVQSGADWNLQGNLVAADGSGAQFGASVAVGGTTALIGAPAYPGGASVNPGAAYVFGASDAGWTEQALLSPEGGANNDGFGTSVALSGNLAIVGASGRAIVTDAGTVRTGAAYVFAHESGAWTLQTELTPGDGAGGDNFGDSVALSGNLAIVGAGDHAVLRDAGIVQQGAAYVFVLNGGVWTEQTELVANDGALGDLFGISVALSGNTALVAAENRNEPLAQGSNAAQGGAYFFVENDAGQWIQAPPVTAVDGAPFELFGSSASLSGTTALLGGPGTNASYVFQLVSPKGSTCVQNGDCQSAVCYAGVCCETVCTGGDVCLAGVGTCFAPVTTFDGGGSVDAGFGDGGAGGHDGGFTDASTDASSQGHADVADAAAILDAHSAEVGPTGDASVADAGAADASAAQDANVMDTAVADTGMQQSMGPSPTGTSKPPAVPDAAIAVDAAVVVDASVYVLNQRPDLPVAPDVDAAASGSANDAGPSTDTPGPTAGSCDCGVLGAHGERRSEVSLLGLGVAAAVVVSRRRRRAGP